MTVGKEDKTLIWFADCARSIQSPPMGADARIDAGFYLRQIQQGVRLSMPVSRPMPGIGKHVHELRIADRESNCIWRIVYRIDFDVILIVEVFKKKDQKTPKRILDGCKKRLKDYDSL